MSQKTHTLQRLKSVKSPSDTLKHVDRSYASSTSSAHSNKEQSKPTSSSLARMKTNETTGKQRILVRIVGKHISRKEGNIVPYRDRFTSTVVEYYDTDAASVATQESTALNNAMQEAYDDGGQLYRGQYIMAVYTPYLEEISLFDAWSTNKPGENTNIKLLKVLEDVEEDLFIHGEIQRVGKRFQIV